MRGSGRTFVRSVTALTGILSLAVGIWGIASPSSFADSVDFPASVHFIHDAGAFQLGIGATLLLALIWRDALAVALAGFLVGNIAHSVNHAVDLDLGGSATQLWLLVVWSLLVAVALYVWLRQLGWVVGEVPTATTPALEPFVRQKTVLLTSYRRDGTPVGAPVSLAVEGDHAYFRSPGKGWKVRRIRNNPMVEVAPCTTRGKVTGPAIRGRAKQIDGAGAAHAASVLRRKHPLLHGVLVPASHRLFRGKFGRTAHFELVPLEDQGRVARIS
jgi:PPOX class probable F420-dependent enzyme